MTLVFEDILESKKTWYFIQNVLSQCQHSERVMRAKRERKDSRSRGALTPACSGTEAVWGVCGNLAPTGQPITTHIQ